MKGSKVELLPSVPSPADLRAFSSSFGIFVGLWYPTSFSESEVSPLVAISEFRIIPCFCEQNRFSIILGETRLNYILFIIK